MQLVTFGIDREMNLVIQFPVFIQPYIQKPLTLYQLETVLLLILDTNKDAQSYTHLHVNKPYTALNSETYISLTQQELRSCKKIGDEFYCEEYYSLLNINPVPAVKVLSTLNLSTDIIRNNCNFDFYYNKTNVTPSILDGGDEIILANWPNNKHIICNVNNDIPFRIPSHPYVLVNRSIQCKCSIEADSHHLLESLAMCDSRQSKLLMYFTINLAFSNYLELIQNMTEHKTLNRDKTLREQPLPIYINISCYDTTLSDRSTKLKEFIQNNIHNNNDKEIFDLQRRHTRHTFSPNKNFFLNKIVIIFTFTSSIISVITITLVMYLFCKHKHIRTIVARPIAIQSKRGGSQNNNENR